MHPPWVLCNVVTSEQTRVQMQICAEDMSEDLAVEGKPTIIKHHRDYMWICV